MNKQEFLHARQFNLIKSHQESFIKTLDKALRLIDAGQEAEAEKYIGQADALWRKVRKVHGVEL